MEESPAEGVFFPNIKHTLEKVSERLQEQYDNRLVHSGLYNQTMSFQSNAVGTRTSLFIQDSSFCTIIIQPKINNITLVNCQNIRLVYSAIVNKLEIYKCSDVQSISGELPSVVFIDSCNGVHLSCTFLRYLKNYHVCCVFTIDVSLSVHFLSYNTPVPIKCGLYPAWQYSTFLVMTHEKVYARPYPIRTTHEQTRVTSLCGKGSVYYT